MKTQAFLDRVQHDRIHQAIQTAEAGTSARLVVYVSHATVTDPLIEAHRVFRKLHLESGHEKAGLLLFVAPKSRKFAVLGGTALHAKLGQAWWHRMADLIGGHFKQDRFTEGLLAAIAEADEAFHAHFSSSEPRPAHETDIYDR